MVQISVVRFVKFIKLCCCDRLKLELLKAGDEIYFEHQMKKQVLIQKKCAAMEKEKAEKYLQLEKIYVCHYFILKL